MKLTVFGAADSPRPSRRPPSSRPGVDVPLAMRLVNAPDAAVAPIRDINRTIGAAGQVMGAVIGLHSETEFGLVRHAVPKAGFAVAGEVAAHTVGCNDIDELALGEKQIACLVAAQRVRRASSLLHWPAVWATTEGTGEIGRAPALSLPVARRSRRRRGNQCQGGGTSAHPTRRTGRLGVPQNGQMASHAKSIGQMHASGARTQCSPITPATPT